SSSAMLPASTACLSLLSLHDALPISSFSKALKPCSSVVSSPRKITPVGSVRSTYSFSQVPLVVELMEYSMMLLPLVTFRPEESRSEEHTSELQSRFDLLCRLLLDRKR